MESKTIKQQIIEMLSRLPDDIGYDRAIDGIRVMRALEISLQQADRGEGTDHEEFMRELLGEDEEIPRTYFKTCFAS
jgi:hypothetical protein